MRTRSRARRVALDYAVRAASTVSALIGIFFLCWILVVVIHRGSAALNWDFFTKLPAPPGAEGGGMANAILGTLIMTAIAGAIGVPIGVLTGVYLSEYGRGGTFASLVRFTVNVMMGLPSIITGLFVYTMLVVTLGHFSGWAGAVSLVFIIMPIVAGTTEDMLRMVPDSMRESALALGAPSWRTTLGIVFRGAKVGLITGVLLAIARATGETAPLLFTSLNSPYWPGNLNHPTGNLTVTIFSYALWPCPAWQQMAWGASLLITVGVLSMTILTRLALVRKG